MAEKLLVRLKINNPPHICKLPYLFQCQHAVMAVTEAEGEGGCNIWVSIPESFLTLSAGVYFKSFSRGVLQLLSVLSQHVLCILGKKALQI
jgi:hypothetical protein